jgi:predicted nucleic acid-binding protein
VILLDTSVLYRVFRRRRPGPQERQLQATFGAPVGDHLEAARLKNLCAGKGVNVSGIDCLIAASAIAGGHELFAVDADFEAICRHSSLKLFREDGVAQH